MQRRCSLGEWRLGAGTKALLPLRLAATLNPTCHPSQQPPTSSTSLHSTRIPYTIHIDVKMANSSRYYYSLPTQPPQQPRSTSGSRRPPLTPSTVSSPCLTTQSTIASRRDSGSGSPTKASALLARVASHPSTPRAETPSSSAIQSPESQIHSSPVYSPDRPAMWRSESARYVHQYRQQGMHLHFLHISPHADQLQMDTLASQTLRSSASLRTHTSLRPESTTQSTRD